MTTPMRAAATIHAGRHAKDGPDPVAPDAIGALSADANLTDLTDATAARTALGAEAVGVAATLSDAARDAAIIAAAIDATTKANNATAAAATYANSLASAAAPLGLTSAGAVGASGNFARADHVHPSTVAQSAVGDVALIVTLAASATGDFQQWRNSAGTSITSITSTGLNKVVGLTSSGLIQTNQVGNANSGVQLYGSYPFQFGTSYWNGSSASFESVSMTAVRYSTTPGDHYINLISGFQVNPQTVTTKGLIVKSLASHTANALSVMDSSGNILAFTSPVGFAQLAGWQSTASAAMFRNGNAVSGAQTKNSQTLSFQTAYWTGTSQLTEDIALNGMRNSVTPGDHYFNIASGLRAQPQLASVVGLVVKGAASQSADLTEWQDSTGALLAYVNAFGTMYTSARLIAGADSSVAPQFVSTSTSATRIPMVVKAAASQTADLHQWQNSSGLTLAKITFAGEYWSPQNAGIHFLDNSTAGALGWDPSMLLLGSEGRIQSFATNIGTFYLNNMYFDGAAWRGVSSAVPGAYLSVGNGKIVMSGAAAPATNNGTVGPVTYWTGNQSGNVTHTSIDPATVSHVIRTPASMSADILSLQNSASAVLTKIKVNGEYESVVNAVSASDAGGGKGGVVLRSPNGTRYRMTVADDGALTTVAA